MKADLLVSSRVKISDASFAELKIWAVPAPVHGSAHGFKYRLAHVVEGACGGPE